MVTRSVRRWHRALVDELARRADAQAQRKIPSLELRRSLHIRRPRVDTAILRVPQYWAYFVHYGSGPVNDKLMIWFRDPAKDPRLRPRPPVRLSQKKSLTKAQFIEARRANEIIVAYRRRAIKGTPWFSNQGNMAVFLRDAKQVIPKRFSELVRFEMKDLGVPRPLKL